MNATKARVGSGCVRGAVLLLAGWTSLAAADTQTFRLDPGWNLISFQVVPTNPSPAVVFGPLGVAFERAFSYDSASAAWSTYARTGTNDASLAASPLPPVDVGRAYWVYMNQLVPAWAVTGSVPAVTPAVNLRQGWNLVGLPTGAGQLPESVNIQAVLAAAGLDYDTILRWEQTLYGKFTPADTDINDWTTFDPNRGLWINVKTPSFSLQPKLLASVRADVDNEPFNNYPSYEDLRLSDSPTPLGANNQTHIAFLPGEDTQTLGIANTGGGILLWEASVTNAPWLILSATRGVTTIENDLVYLYLDRQNLAPGRYTATLNLRTTAGNRAFTVVANVTGLAGEWRGQAVIASANGRHNPLPEVDLHVSFFEDPAIPGLLRGLIDSQNALLWPVDVPLAGHTGGGTGNGFRLSGGFVLPPGDVNNAPFNVFDPLVDVDWNCNGKYDAVNPYPFPIYRAVTLNGALTVGSGRDGYELRGEYSEIVYGMLRDPIYLQGDFVLKRESPQPYASRRPVANQEPSVGTLPVVLKTFAPPTPANLPAGRTTNSLNFITDLALGDVSVDLDVSDTPASDLRIWLVAPGGQTVLIHDQGNVSSLRSMSYPSARPPAESFAKLLTNSISTKGRWSLVLENNGAVLGKLYSWSLRLSGQPVFNLAGRVVDKFGNPVPAQVFANGLPFSEIAQADANGFFTFNRLPGLPLNFTAAAHGYLPDPLTPDLGGPFTLPSYPTNCASPAKLTAMAKFRPLPLAPFPGGATEGFGTNAGSLANPYLLDLVPDPNAPGALVAVPESGFAPLPVTLYSTLTDPGLTNLFDYGDGSPLDVTVARIREHTYATSNPTGYLASVQFTNGPFPLAATVQVYPMPSPGNTPYAVNFFQIFASGGGALPENLLAQLDGPTDPSAPAALATLLTVQHTYCASFDIDLAPKATPGASFYSDGFDPLNTLVNPANREGNFRDEDYNYQVGNGTGPGQWSSAADCGYAVADDIFNPHPRLGQTGDCAAPRFMMLCNIGPLILPTTADEVYAITPAPIYGSTPDPLATSDASGLSGNRALKLITGPLATFWNR